MGDNDYNVDEEVKHKKLLQKCRPLKIRLKP